MKRGTKLIAWTVLATLLGGAALLLFGLHQPAQTPEQRRAEIYTTHELAVLGILSNPTNAVRIGNIPDSPPIDFREGSGERKGLTWDHARLVEEELGIRFVRVETADWEQDLLDGKIDLVGSVQRTPDRTTRFNFSKPYWKIKFFILARKDSAALLSLDDMHGQKVAVVKGAAIHDHLLEKKRADPGKFGYDLLPVKDVPTGMRLVSEGRADAMVADGAVSRYHMPRLGVDLRVAGEVDYSWNLAYAVRTNGLLTATMIDAAQAQVSEKQLDQIEQLWPTLPRFAEVDKLLLVKVIVTSLLLTLLAIGLVLFWNQKLRRRVSQHMRELGRARESHAQAARALGRSEERFRVLVESSSDMIWETDQYGTYTYVSPRVRDILGYTPEEMVGQSCFSLMVPHDAARKMAELRKSEATTIIDCETATYVHKKGRPVILESSGMAYAGNTGELAGFRGVSRDITDRIENENALRRSEERFRNLVETTSDWIWEVDTEGRFTYASPQVGDLLGYAPADLMGKHFTSPMPPPEAKAVRRLFGEVLNQGASIQSLVTTNLHRSGRTVMLETSAVPFYDKEWNIQGYRGIGRDITDRVAAEKQLEFERNLFRSFMQHAPDLIYFKDREGRFIEVNAAKAEELHLEPEAVVGRTDFDFLPEEEARQRYDDELGIMRSRTALQKEEMATTPDGVRWYFTTKVPRYDEEGEVVGTFGTSWDVTHRKLAEEQLRQLRALLSNTIDSMPSVLVGVDAEGNVIQWNRQAESVAGRLSSESLGQPLRSVFPQLGAEMVKVERAIRERRVQKEERLPVQENDRTRYRDITVYPLLEGETEGAVIRVDDVTDRVMIENSIRNIVEGVASVGRRFFDSMVVQLAKTLDADFTFIAEFSDETHERIRAIAAAEGGVARPGFEYDLARTPCAAVVAGDRCIHIDQASRKYPEMEMLRTMGIEDYIGIPLVDSEKRSLGLMVAMYRKPVERFGFAADIMQVFAGRTAAELERLQATKQLVALRNLLENIIDSMPSILVGVDADGRVMQWNREAENITGIDASHAQGLPLLRVFPDFGSEMSRLLDAVGQQASQHHERVPCSIRGEQRIVDVTVYPVTADGSEGAVIRVDDVTDRVRIEEMMVQSEKMMSVGGLAAGMAHEINNPLAGILQNLQVMRNRLTHETGRNIEAARQAGTTLEAIRAYMEARGLIGMMDTISEAGRRAAKIVDNMLSFSRKDEAHFAPNNLEEIIERSIELASNDYNLKKRFDFRHIRIVRDYAPLEPIPCEGSQIQQVLLNLLSNSAQAMAGRTEGAPDPQITIRLRKEHDMARIEVEDNGPGMDAETRKRVFEPFFTTKEVGHGTGLGLSVSYFIITENHGGSMGVVSSPGRGACFTVRIPFERRVVRQGLRL